MRIQKHSCNIAKTFHHDSHRGLSTIRGVTLTLLLALLGAILMILITPPPCVAVPQADSPQRITESQLNITFIKPGSTTRAEVMQKLAWADAGVKEDRLFLARWVSSSDGAGDADQEVPDAVRRNWHAHNLMVESDPQGIVTKVRDVSDKHLVEALSGWIANHPSAPLDLRMPIQIPVSYRRQSASLLLTSESFEFRSARKGCWVSPSDLKRISLATRFRTPRAEAADEAIYFTEKTTAGSKVTLQTDVAHMFILLKYVQQTRLALTGR